MIPAAAEATPPVAPRVLHLTLVHRAVDPAREAVLQDLRALGGHEFNIAPAPALRRLIPERLFGLAQAGRLAALAREADVVHVWHPRNVFWVLRGWRKPMVLSAVAGLAPGHVRRLRANEWLVAGSQRDVRAAGGHARVRLIRPGIDLDRFPRLPAPPPTAPLRVLMASAPWQPRDFGRKGIDGLLGAMQRVPDVRATFLWRGILADAMHARVRAAGLQQRVSIIDARADVPALLAEHHAAVLVCGEPDVVKGHPNSLMEALACGRPVITHAALAISEDLHDAGVLAADGGPDAWVAALQTLRARYDALLAAAQAYPRALLDRARWVAQHHALYREVAAHR